MKQITRAHSFALLVTVRRYFKLYFIYSKRQKSHDLF